MTRREQILDAITELGPTGATTDEIEVLLNLPHQCVSGRISRLVQDGYLSASGMRTTRKGRMGQVWIATGKQLEPELNDYRKRRKAKEESDPSPTFHRSFWADIRKRILKYVLQGKKIDDGELQRLMRNLEADLRECADRFTDALTRARSLQGAPPLAVSRRQVVEACRALHMDLPGVGEPVDLNVAKRNKRKLVREYHTDVTGNEATREAFQSVVTAFDLLEQYNHQLEGTHEIQEA